MNPGRRRPELEESLRLFGDFQASCLALFYSVGDADAAGEALPGRVWDAYEVARDARDRWEATR